MGGETGPLSAASARGFRVQSLLEPGFRQTGWDSPTLPRDVCGFIGLDEWRQVTVIGSTESSHNIIQD